MLLQESTEAVVLTQPLQPSASGDPGAETFAGPRLGAGVRTKTNGAVSLALGTCSLTADRQLLGRWDRDMTL